MSPPRPKGDPAVFRDVVARAHSTVALDRAHALCRHPFAYRDLLILARMGFVRATTWDDGTARFVRISDAIQVSDRGEITVDREIHSLHPVPSPELLLSNQIVEEQHAADDHPHRP